MCEFAVYKVFVKHSVSNTECLTKRKARLPRETQWEADIPLFRRIRF